MQVENIIRVFPRRTRATPTDELAFIGNPPPLFIVDYNDKLTCRPLLGGRLD